MTYSLKKPASTIHTLDSVPLNATTSSTLILHRLTGVTSHVDFETTGLVVRLVAAREAASEVARFSEVSAIVGEQGTEGDEGFFTACT